MTSSWSAWNTPLKHSQASLDAFERWKREQNTSIAKRGEDAENPAKEEEYNQFMLRQNLNAFICYDQVDQYMTCLKDNHLLRREEDSGHFEINTASKANEKLCRKTHNTYVECMSSKVNQETILLDAVQHPNCTDRKENLMQCMQQHSEVEEATGKPQCEGLYRTLLRCGLNHQWNHYWRSLTKYGDAEEYRLYELSKDDGKKQEYMRLATSTSAEQEAYQRHVEQLKKGYYADPRDAQAVGER